MFNINVLDLFLFFSLKYKLIKISFWENFAESGIASLQYFYDQHLPIKSLTELYGFRFIPSESSYTPSLCGWVNIALFTNWYHTWMLI